MPAAPKPRKLEDKAMTAPLKLKKTTLSGEVCKIIKEKIRDGDWPAGARLPSENELAVIFGVNRLTVRNALQKLSAMGIVETRAGEGTFVKQFNLLDYISEISDLVTSPEMLQGVLEFRKCVEVECGRLAILRASEEDLVALEVACAQYETVAGDQSKSFEEHIADIINADLDFHNQICTMSKNSLFVLAYATSRELIFQYIRTVLFNRYVNYTVGLKRDTASSVALANHRKILEAIRHRDFALYQKTYIDMIDFENLE